jgi:hypothetical protein
VWRGINAEMGKGQSITQLRQIFPPSKPILDDFRIEFHYNLGKEISVV